MSEPEKTVEQLKLEVQLAAFRMAVALYLPGFSDVTVDKCFAVYLASSHSAGGMTPVHAAWALEALRRVEPRPWWQWWR